MNPFVEILLRNGLLFDALGVCGLGLIGLSAVRLSRSYRSWGGSLMAAGAIGLLVARLFIIARPLLGDMLDGNSARFAAVLVPVFLTLGLAAVVWGVWAHERGLRESR